jgi:hypothetical protein
MKKLIGIFQVIFFFLVGIPTFILIYGTIIISFAIKELIIFIFGRRKVNLDNR